jgi:diguanylate cyclase (GGDEF)-like protein
MKFLCRLLGAALFFAALTPPAALASGPITLQENVNKFPLARHMSVFEDTEGKLGIEDILQKDAQGKFKPNTKGRENFGQNPSAFWFKITLQNPLDHEQKVILEEGFPHIDHVDVYLLQHGKLKKHFQTGDTYPYEKREFDYRTFLFEVAVPARGALNVYIRTQTKAGAQHPLFVWRQQGLISKINQEQTVLGLYFGILGAMILYNLFLFISLRDRTYLYYVLFVASMFFQQLGLSRMDSEYLWPNMPQFANTSHFVSYCSSFFFAALFCRSFLNTKKHTPWIDKSLLFMMGLCVLTALIIIAGYLRAGISIIIYVIASLEPLILLAAGLVCWIRGRKVARYYTIAWTVLVVMAVINNLRSIGLVEPTFFAYYAAHIGSATEAVLLSLALADRINIIKGETLAAKDRAFEAEKALTNELEKQVAERTKELQVANKELEKQSNTDGLTNVFNRRYFDRQLESEWRRHERSSLPMALIMADIDFFKQYNDNYGHQAGDACLQAVARALEASAQRPHDVVARYGGEEFVALLPETDTQGAEAVAQAMKEAIDGLSIPHDNSSGGGTLSLSFGVSALVPDRDTDPSSLITLADQALYHCKKSGRDRIIVSTA